MDHPTIGTYGCVQALLGTISILKSTRDLDATKDPDIERIANRKAMCLLRVSLSYNISQSALYNAKIPDLLCGSGKKAWDNLYNVFYPNNVNKMKELKNEFVRNTLYRDVMIPDEWFISFLYVKDILKIIASLNLVTRK
jgi:hypothetical protein